jgi:hypothetical protein
VLILSLIAPVLLYGVGGFFFAASGFGIDSELPPTSPRRIVGALLGYTPGLVLVVIALILSLSATGRSRQLGWFVGLLIWPVVPIAAGVLMVTGVTGFSDLWWLAALGLPLGTFLYSLLGPPPSPDGVQTPIRRAPFLSFVGVLTLVTLLGFVTLARGALPFASPPAPTPTVGPLVLTVQVATGPANCITGAYPTITLTNIAQQTVSWSAQVNDSGITVAPASGNLDAGASAAVMLSGRATTSTFFTVTFLAQSSQNLAKIACVAS